MNILSKSAHENFKDTVSLKKSMNRGFLEVGRLLKENKDNKFYETLGYETFEAYLGTPELSISRSTANALIQIYDKLILKMDVQPAVLEGTDWTKLQMILPKVTEDNLEDLLDKAQHLSKSDLKEEVHEGTADDEYTVCSLCGGSGRIKK